MNESIVKKQISNKYSSSKFSYFTFENNEFFADEVSSTMFPIRKGKVFGSIIIDILNLKNQIFNSFDLLIQEMSSAESFDNIPDILISYCDKVPKEEYLHSIFITLRNQYYEYKKSLGTNLAIKIQKEKENILKFQALLKDEKLLQSTSPELPLKRIKELVNSDIEFCRKQISNYENNSDDWKIAEINKRFSRYLSNIKSTIENFCTYLSNNQSDVKTYLLWDMHVPSSTYQFGVWDNEDQGIYLQNVIDFDRFHSTNSIDRLIDIKRYQINDFLDLLNLFIDFYFQKKYIINKCEYCGKYFIPTNRSDEKYCDNPCPDNPSKTCKEYASKKLYDEKKKSDVIKKEHYNTSQYFRMKIKRAKTEREEYSYTRKLEIYMENYEKKKKKFDNNKITEDEFANWIVAQKEL